MREKNYPCSYTDTKYVKGRRFDLKNGYFCVLSMILYSFYAALLRYLCTVRTERVDQFGKDRLIRIIYCIFYLHTSVWALYTILTSFNTDHLPLINSCYGYADRVFMMEHSTLEMLQRHFCAHDMDEGRNIFHFDSYYHIFTAINS